MDSKAIEEAIKATVPGQTWYWCGRGFGARWTKVEVERVTKTLVVFTNGLIVTKTKRADSRGNQYFPPTPEMVEVYAAQELKDEAMNRYHTVLNTLGAAYRGLTPAQLLQLAKNLENALELSGIK